MDIKGYIMQGLESGKLELYDVFSGESTRIQGSEIVGSEGVWFNLDEAELELDLNKSRAFVKDKMSGDYVDGNSGNPFWFEIRVCAS